MEMSIELCIPFELVPDQRGAWNRTGLFENLRAVRSGGSVRGAAVFAGIARDHAEVTALRAGNPRGPFVHRKHEQQARQPPQQSAQRPADAPSTRESEAAG